MHPSAPRLPPDVLIPDHELLRPIGRGSYGEVWLARTVLGEYRAVKIVRRSAFDHDRPVERELEGIQKYEPISRSHENQVHLLHVGRLPDGFYYVMELADDLSEECGMPSVECRGSAERAMRSEGGERPNGKSLGARRDGVVEWWNNGNMRINGNPSPRHSGSSLPHPDSYTPKTLRGEMRRRGRLPVEECLEIGLKLTDALGHLHKHGLVHRDVKPSNIIFVRGQPKLADIGLVTSSDSSRSCVGTEGYLPPEGPGRPPADLFALGKVLYEISTGRDRADFPELPTLLREDPQRRLLEEFNEVILRACEPDGRHRYATAQALRADLEWLHAGKSLQQVKRRERRWAGVRKLAIAATLVGMLLAWNGSWENRPREAGRHLPIRLVVDGAEFWRVPFMTRQFDFSPDGERIVFAGTNEISIWERKTRITRRLELRGEGGWKIAGARGAIAMPRWAPDSRQFIYQAVKQVGGSVEGPVLAYAFLLVNADTGQVQQIGPDLIETERANDLCWHPEGKAVTVVDSQNRLMTLSLQGERTLWQETGLSGARAFRLGDYSPDGDWLLISTGSVRSDDIEDRHIWAIPHLGGPGQQLTQRAGVEAYPTWDPDGRAVYFISKGGHPRNETWGLWKVLVDRQTCATRGPATPVFIRNGAKFLHPKFVAGGRKLAYAVMEPETSVWLSGTETIENRTEVVRGQDPALSPDGQTIYFVGELPDQKGVFAIHRNGHAGSLRKITELTPLSTGLTSSGLSLSPDGQRLALFGHDGTRYGIFVVPTGRGPARLIEAIPRPDAPIPVWSPDAQWLAFIVDQQLVRTTGEGRFRERLAILPRWQAWSLRWSPDGAYLAALGSAIADPKSPDCGVYVVAVAEKTVRKLTPKSEHQWMEGLEWHPSSQFLTYMRYGPERFSAQIRRAYLDGRSTDLMIDQPDHWDYLGVWAPDGRRFYFITSAEKGHESPIHLYDLQTQQVTHGLWSGDLRALPRWSRDGRAVVYTVGGTERYFEEIEIFSVGQ